jgi:hypothetical protein
VWKEILAFEPFDEKALRARRVALVDFLGKAIFQDRRQGAEIAAKIIEDTPMPDCANFKGQFHSSEVKDK